MRSFLDARSKLNPALARNIEGVIRDDMPNYGLVKYVYTR